MLFDPCVPQTSTRPRAKEHIISYQLICVWRVYFERLPPGSRRFEVLCNMFVHRRQEAHQREPASRESQRAQPLERRYRIRIVWRRIVETGARVPLARFLITRARVSLPSGRAIIMPQQPAQVRLRAHPPRTDFCRINEGNGRTSRGFGDCAIPQTLVRPVGVVELRIRLRNMI